MFALCSPTRNRQQFSMTCNRLVSTATFLPLCLGEILRLKWVALDPILCLTLAFHDLGLSHATGNLLDSHISWRVQSGADDGEPHVRLHVVPWQSVITIHIGQPTFCLPHSS